MNELLKNDVVVERDGIFVAKEIANKTVWDTLAIENPTHAVISAADEESARKKSEEQIADISTYANENSVLLDLGSGYGRVAKYLLPKQRLKQYVAIDSSYEMLQLFKKRYLETHEEQSTPVTLVNADIHTLPLADNSVDVAVVCAVFLHNHKSITEKSIKELERVLKPGATLLVYSSFPRGYTAMGLQGNLYQALLNMLGKPYKNGPVRYFSKRELNKLFADFSKITYVPDNFAFLPKTIIILPGIIERVYRLLIANPINSLLRKVLPEAVARNFAVHFDVIAKR